MTGAEYMDVIAFNHIPAAYQKIRKASMAIDFTMASDLYTGTLLKTLAASKKVGRFLELGTGTGLATAWIADGMDDQSTLVSIENNNRLIDIAKQYLNDDRVKFITGDAYDWIRNYKDKKFDFIFADAMPGKYELFDEVIALLKKGGLYIIDDMLPQPNWPLGHDKKVEELINKIEQRDDLLITKLNWSTGIIIASKK